MNEVFKSFNDYLKYEGIEIRDKDIAKLIDVYERIIVALTVGEINNSVGLNILFTGDKNINFLEMSEEGIESIKNFIKEVNSNCASYPISTASLKNLFTGNNIVTVFRGIHQLIGTILGIGREYIKNNEDGSGILYAFSSRDEEKGTHMTIRGFRTTNDEILFKMESDSFVTSVPSESIRI